METTINNSTEILPAPPAEPDLPARQKRSNASQNQRISAGIARAAAFCAVLEHDPELAALLEPRLHAAEELTMGKQLTQNAQLALTRRQSLMGQEDEVLAEVKRLCILVRTDLVDFREVARARLLTAGSDAALGLEDSLSKERGKLVVQARITYTTAKESAYQVVLSRSGYSTATLDGLLSDVSDLENARTHNTQAQGAAERATTERNQAYEALSEWHSTTKRIVRRTLRERPDLLHKLGM